jgi:hypothetical protein
LRALGAERWLNSRAAAPARSEAKLAAPWTAALQAQATAFYLRNYVESFTQPDVCTAYASIPGVMVVDDHDLWDGFGSYDPDLQACPVFQGLFAVAQRFFLLFQQHTTAARDAGAGESDFLGRGGGAEGFHSVRYLGPQVAALAIDMRTQRAKRRILPEASYQLIRNAALELAPSVQHVVALSGVPLVFPEIPFSETILNGVKALARRSACVGGLGRTAGILDRFDQPEILDDLIDGWAAHIHHGRGPAGRQLRRRAVQWTRPRTLPSAPPAAPRIHLLSFRRALCRRRAPGVHPPAPGDRPGQGCAGVGAVGGRARGRRRPALLSIPPQEAPQASAADLLRCAPASCVTDRARWLGRLWGEKCCAAPPFPCPPPNPPHPCRRPAAPFAAGTTRCSCSRSSPRRS